VICRNLEAFKTINPNIQNSIGDMPFGLSSNGDQIRLYDADRHVIDAVDYYTVSPWPENANGTGATIELINPDYDNTKGENWKGGNSGGTPGVINYWKTITDIENPSLNYLIKKFESFPNPFTDFTTIQFTVLSEGEYRLEVFDMNGRLVDVLSDSYLTKNTYYIDWFGTTKSGVYLSGGIYTIRLSNKNQVETIKVVMLK
jgi:hypothetical protein